MPEVAPTAEDVARALSVGRELVLETWCASVGARFCFVRLATKKAVDAAMLDRSFWQTTIASAWSPNLYFFAGDPRAGGALYARMFAPALGVEEDPATGSAAAALVGSVAMAVPDGELRLHIDQGVVLGRPSVIRAGAECRAGKVVAIHVTGTTVLVGQGTILAPPGG